MNADEKEARLGYLILLPVFLTFALVIFFPTIKALLDSFSNLSLYNKQNPAFIGLKNYVGLFTNSAFWQYVVRTFVLVFLAVGLQYVLGLALALLLNEELPGLKWAKSIIMIPWVIPVAAMVVMFNWMSTPDYGLFNMILSSIGLEEMTRYWLGDKAFAFAMVVLMHVWRNMPFYAMMLYAALKAVPKIQYEAANIDGANAWQKFKHITLPNIKYPSMIVIVLHVLWTFNNFDVIYLSTGGGPVGKTEVLATQVYQMAWTNYEYGKASALGIVMMLAMLAFSTIYIKLVRSDR